jgi:hypothetical protein
MTMTPRREDLAARTGDAANRDRGSRRVSSAIAARLHLNARRADGTKVDRVGWSDPRDAFLTRSYD